MMTNEEKILEILEKHGSILEKQGEMLEKHGEILEKHGEILQNLTEKVDSVDKRMDRLDERSQRTAVLLETEVDRKLNLLYEGHDAIMENLDKLAPKDRVEMLENDVALLKDVVKLMRQEIRDLKKAQ